MYKTGYASSDKPWLKWHEPIIGFEYERYSNFYEYFRVGTALYGNSCILEYLGKKMLLNDFIAEVDFRAIQLRSIGIHRGSIVSLMMLNTPEVVILILALSKIGACCNLIKYDESPERVNSSLCLTASEFLFITQVPNILKTASYISMMENSIIEIIEVPLTNHANPPQKGSILYKDFFEKIKIDNSKGYENTSSNDTCVIVYTGGTTGTAKGIELTHKNMMAMCYGEKHSNFGWTHGKTSMNILPPAVAYYLNATIGFMYCGILVCCIPYFQIEEYPDLVFKHKPNIIMSGPILLKQMELSNIDDFSYLTNPVSGGDKLYSSEEIQINHALSKKGCTTSIQQGYGESEVSAVATCNPQGYTRIGSIGIPMQNVIVSIFEHGTDNELKYGEDHIGEICITGPTLMKGYYKNPEATRSVMWLHKDGQYWIHTDDLGRMDKDGFIYHCGRAKRMLTRRGNKIWLATIESAISEFYSVLECCAVKMEDDQEREVPVLHIVLKPFIDINSELIDAINLQIKEKCSEWYVPKYYVFRKEIPYTETNKKKDFRSLEKENIFDTSVFKQISESVFLKRR